MRVYPNSTNSYDQPDLSLLGFQKRKCKYIIPDPESAETLCSCLKPINEHDYHVLSEYNTRKNSSNPSLITKWDKEDCTQDDGPTDAYGRIKFNDEDVLSSYVRVSFKTSVEKLETLLFDENFWSIKKPELIISVTGGAEKIYLNPKLKDAFSRGLVKAAVTTNALVTTGGTYGGCMKLVGEAFKEMNALSIDQSKKVSVLGIASWCSIFNNSRLIRKENSKENQAPIDYELSKPREEKKSLLDPNHTHFILVDDAYNYFGGELKLRAKLEASLRKKAKTVVVVLGGGPNTAVSIFNAIEEGTPCVILESTGEMECGFSYAINRIKNLSTVEDQKRLLKDGTFWEDVRKRLINGFSKKKDHIKRAENTLKMIKKSLDLKYLHLLTVCRSKNGRTELDVAILEALLYAENQTNTKKNFESQLKLALNWNRIDIARNFLFNEENRDKICNLENFMTKALIENKHEFVELFLENGFSFKSYLTHRRLLYLYNSIPKTSSCMFHKMLDKHAENVVDTTKAKINDSLLKKNEFAEEKNLITFELIGKVLTELVNYIYEDKFKRFPFDKLSKHDYHKIFIKGSTSNGEQVREVPGIVRLENNYNFHFDETCENPYHEMFIFSILLTRYEMSMIFFTRISNSICSALIATKICKYYANEFEDDSHKCEQMAQDFEILACDILKLYHETDELNSQLTLIRKIEEFGNVTSMKVATSSQDLNFIATQSFQNVLVRIWYHKMLPDTNKFKILICLACPFLAPFLMSIRKKSSQANTKSKKSELLIKTQQIDTLQNFDEENPAFDDDETLIKKIDAEYSNEFFDRGTHGGYNYFEFIYHFFNTPFVKFVYHQVFYLLFLLLFSYVILCDFNKINRPTKNDTSLDLAISIPEIVLMIWIFAFVTEEVRKFLKDDMKKYYLLGSFLDDFWQKINIGAIFLYLVAFILRFIDNDECYEAARIILAIDIIFWFLKSLKAYTFLRQLGPKLYMIKEMLIQLAYFFLIVLLFMFAFGVSTTALMFQNQNLDVQLLKSVFLPAYFMIGGEYFTREVIMDASAGQCSDSSPYTSCPEETGSGVTLAIYVIYLIFLNILLVNLLIAIFNNTYDTIEQEANKIWKSQRYALVHEYYNKPLFPAPFVMINYAFSVLKIALRLIRLTFPKNPKQKSCFSSLNKNRFFRYLTKKWTAGFIYELEEEEEKKITKIEEHLTNELIGMRERDIKDNFEAKVEQNYDKLDILALKFEEFLDKGNQSLDDKIKLMDRNIKELSNSLKILF